MLLADAPAYLDPAERQIFDTLRHKIETRRRDHQQSELVNARAKPVKPKGDRMMVRQC